MNYWPETHVFLLQKKVENGKISSDLESLTSERWNRELMQSLALPCLTTHPHVFPNSGKFWGGPTRGSWSNAPCNVVVRLLSILPSMVVQEIHEILIMNGGNCIQRTCDDGVIVWIDWQDKLLLSLNVHILYLIRITTEIGKKMLNDFIS